MEMDDKRSAKVHHATLFVSSMDRARYLFQDILGFDLLWHAPMVKGYKMALLLGLPAVEMEMVYLQNRPGHTAIELCRVIHPQREPSPHTFGSPGTAALSLEVKNIDLLHARLTREGWPPFSSCLDMRDPEGNPVRLCCFAVEGGMVVELVEKNVG
jgi:catechol 2,3-dioxygenase-like lactoylglutathione lyase family enzyme